MFTSSEHFVKTKCSQMNKSLPSQCSHRKNIWNVLKHKGLPLTGVNFENITNVPPIWFFFSMCFAREHFNKCSFGKNILYILNRIWKEARCSLFLSPLISGNLSWLTNCHVFLNFSQVRIWSHVSVPKQFQRSKIGATASKFKLLDQFWIINYFFKHEIATHLWSCICEDDNSKEKFDVQIGIIRTACKKITGNFLRKTDEFLTFFIKSFRRILIQQS